MIIAVSVGIAEEPSLQSAPLWSLRSGDYTPVDQMAF